MLRKKIIIPVISIGLVFSMAFSLQAEEKKKTVYGNFLFGYRMVDTDGSDYKYREDINLDKGMRLFNFNLHFTPDGDMQKLLDRLDINVYNYGGDPFEALGINIQKYGKYKFTYNRKKAAYFYADQFDTGGGHLYDLHTFNFDRMMDSGMLKVMLHKNVDFYLSFDRYTKKGDSVTTFDINRIEFEYDRPIEEDSRDITLGVNVHLKRYAFLFEEKIQEYETTNSLFLPGYADGGAFARYPSSLSYFFLDQPYDLKTNTHSMKFNARPFDSLLINGSAQLSDQEMDLKYSEGANGVNYMNRLFNYSYTGEGKFDRKIKLYDVDMTFLLTNKLAVIGAVRQSDFEQDGSMTINGNSQSSAFGYTTLGYEAGLQYQFSSGFALTAGYRNEARELEDLMTATYEDKTQRNGFFGNMKLDFSRNFNLMADYQFGNYDDPFTTISPTDFNRFKVTAKIKADQFNFTGSFLTNSAKSEVYNDVWESSKNQMNLRAGYHGEKFKLFAGYSYMKIEHEADRVIEYPPGWSGPAGTFLWDIFYEGKSSIFDGSLAFMINQNWSLGGYANFYSNTGFWEISRNTFKAYLEYVCNQGYVTQIAYRHVNFEEASASTNDYSASIVEFSFGYRWK